MKKTTNLLIFFLLFQALFGEELDQRPNFLIILVDDLGFSDIGCYGSEIDTPNLDRLADNGLRFSQFYNTAKCHASRICLLTGQYYLQAGNDSLKNAVTSAEVLSNAGYHTMMSGKWHLDKEPTDFGFERYFGHLSGATNYYSGDDTFRLNGKPWEVPQKGFYTTRTKVDFAIDFLKESQSIEKPWFLYLSLNAPHAPLQPLEEDYKKYLGKYDAGWDVIRNQRLKKQAELGIFKNPVKPANRPSHVPSWEELDSEWRVSESRRLSAVSAIIDRIDREIGRLIHEVEQAGDLDNTMILFVSDNGASPFGKNPLKVTQEPYNENVKWRDSTGTAWMRNAPFKFYKQNQHEGGISTPAILHWPAGLKMKSGSIEHEPAHLVDVLPTMIEMSGAETPQEWPERKLNQMSGTSLLPILEGKDFERENPIHFQYAYNRALRHGKWKLVSIADSPWELYNMDLDRTETNNLIGSHPEIVQKMSQQWDQIATESFGKPSAFKVKNNFSHDNYFNKRWTDYLIKGSQKKTPKKKNDTAIETSQVSSTPSKDG